MEWYRVCLAVVLGAAVFTVLAVVAFVTLEDYDDDSGKDEG